MIKLILLDLINFKSRKKENVAFHIASITGVFLDGSARPQRSLQPRAPIASRFQWDLKNKSANPAFVPCSRFASPSLDLCHAGWSFAKTQRLAAPLKEAIMSSPDCNQSSMSLPLRKHESVLAGPGTPWGASAHPPLCNQPVVMRDLYSTTGGLAEQEDFKKQNFAPKFEVYKEIGRGSPVL